ncbi:flagellar hook-length control protein FliK [uncultured Propionivibrio sp.]|uniref:flagellar hook-length control protein FliK n=1 Tax=uncultured Propionivibrio sp. TaxID=426737 RepID=UPI0029C0861E|nr:flagellar hook-length control protein FliK [uncultured Propionivibrio sp.]
MIPSDVASRLQVSSDAALRPVAAPQEISDKLSGLVAGQRVMAEIQALLPNGTYRALINQRNITLALPFSAKAGDSLELQVTETDGKLALAVLSRNDGKAAPESVSSTLSQTGKLISTLYAGAEQSRDKGITLPSPITTAPPTSAEDLMPKLKQALQQSGMFYESHQADWVEGRLAKSALLLEPQGKLSAPEAAFAEATANAAIAREGIPQAGSPTGKASEQTQGPRAAAEVINTGVSSDPVAKPLSGQTIAPPLQALVQQQLEALATQNFIWQGQVWPGQDMRWEINEEAARNQQGEESVPQWSTRLRLTLPRLGEIDASLLLHGSQLTIRFSAAEETTRALIRNSGETLRKTMDSAGLTLSSIGVDTSVKDHDDAAETR